jgi:hypothetical protein
MLREPHLTDGIGARIAHNIPCTSTKDALIDRSLTSVTSAKKRKTTKTAKHKELKKNSEKSTAKSSTIITLFPHARVFRLFS